MCNEIDYNNKKKEYISYTKLSQNQKEEIKTMEEKKCSIQT